MQVKLADEVSRRRTAAIIAHPDAGKTTLTEKLLLHGGAIHRAGSVKGRKTDRFAMSDWMEMEKERGISITSSVMQIEYSGYRINLLDTPGHADFSADTYRTLVAGDSAVIVLDGTSGVEKQTRKLFRFCQKQEIPFFIFVNKMDRFGIDPLELIDRIEAELGVDIYACNWPVGRGKKFRGVYDRQPGKVILQQKSEDHGQSAESQQIIELDSPVLNQLMGPESVEIFREEVELLEIAGGEFDRETFLNGQLAPLYFGSAQTNVGIRPFLESFVRLAPQPRRRSGVDPTEQQFGGYIFKIQANMDPNHRDRLAFMRVCSGVFEKGMEVRIVRNDQLVKLAQPRQFMAQERQLIETAFPGDVVGLFDPGIFHIGDSLVSGDDVEYNEVPRFSPEHFAMVKTSEVFKKKHLQQGLEELSEEGAIQLFKPWQGNGADLIVGVVGQLQLEVLSYRLKEEYGVETSMQKIPFNLARWIEGEDLEPARFNTGSYRKLLEDRDGYPLLLFKTRFTLERDRKNHPEITFKDTAPLHRS